MSKASFTLLRNRNRYLVKRSVPIRIIWAKIDFYFKNIVVELKKF